MNNLYVIGYWDKVPSGAMVVDTTSRARSPFSPFLSGCKHPIRANRMENAWQYSKVYPSHDDGGHPNKEWKRWNYEGLNSFFANRYPMGKGAVPLYTWYTGRQLDYIEARKELYIPLYRDMLENDAAQYEMDNIINMLQRIDVYLKDFDGYNEPNKSFDEIVNDPNKKMGHAFILREVILEKCNPNQKTES